MGKSIFFPIVIFLLILIGKNSLSASETITSREDEGYQGKSTVAQVKIATPEEKMILSLIHRATAVSQRVERWNKARLKLVEMGDEVVPVLLDWLEMYKKGEIEDIRFVRPEVAYEILAEIGSPETRPAIADADFAFIKNERMMSAEAFKENLLKKIDLWQSPKRYDNLIQALNDPKMDEKWVIFKLGVLGDRRAIPVLGKILEQNKDLDIRETARDALAHLIDPQTPMRFILHELSEALTLISSAESYTLGETIEITCTITGGPYGSHPLSEFSCPQWQYLPWGNNAEEPFQLNIGSICEFKGMMGPGMMISTTGPQPPAEMDNYGRFIPKRAIVYPKNIFHDQREPLEGYIDIGDLQQKGTFVLQPGQTRSYILKDLNSAFKISKPGNYFLWISMDTGKGGLSPISNRISINIRPDQKPGKVDFLKPTTSQKQ